MLGAWKKFLENYLQVEVVKHKLLAQAEEGQLLLFSCLP